MSGGGRKRREEHEEHENHERWLVTYADMVTLLMVLFIVMFAMSSVDQKKFNELKAGLAAGFGDSTSVMTGSQSTMEQAGSSAVAPVVPENFVGAGAAPTAERAEQALRRQTRELSAAQLEAARLGSLGKELAEALEEAGLGSDVTRTLDDRGLVLSLVSRHVVFEPDRAELSARGQRVLAAVAPVLRTASEDLRIDGHTNQVPVKPRFFATDWDLSAARAITVLRYLNESGRIPADRLSASAFGHEMPLVDPSEPGSQDINKRVDIVVLSSLPAASRELLDDVAAAGTTDAGSTGPASPASDTTSDTTTDTSTDTSTHTTSTGGHP